MTSLPSWMMLDTADLSAMLAGRYGPDIVVPLLDSVPIAGTLLTPLFVVGGPILLGSMAHSAMKEKELLCLNSRGAAMGLAGAIVPLPF